jgi:hypothetical protein
MSQWSKHRMKKADRQAYVNRRARELAVSGKYSGWLEIARVLVSTEGFSESRIWLDNPLTRREIDDACNRAQAAKAARS